MQLKCESYFKSDSILLFRLRNSGAKILRSKRVLLLIVVLNVLDCVLVLGELLLDIHFVKGKAVISNNEPFT